MTPLEVLKAARARLDDPAMWTQGTGPEFGNVAAPTCVALTLDACLGAREVARETDPSHVAADLVLAAIDDPKYRGRRGGDYVTLGYWNDHRDRTHADVLAALDKAIETAAEVAG